jgi:hypothetical protein
VNEILSQPTQLTEGIPLENFEPFKGYIEIEVRDLEGKVIQRGKHKMHSFLNNLMKVLEGFVRASGGTALGSYGTIASMSVTGTDGASKTIAIEWYGIDRCGGTAIALKAPDNDSSYGIVVGSGTTAVNLNSNALASPIAHGTGAGQLDYDTMSIEDLGLDTLVLPPVYRMRLLRGFRNLSGDNVFINEVGIIARNYWKQYFAPGAVYDVKFLIAKDVLPTSYVVPNGGSATVAVVVEVVMG